LEIGVHYVFSARLRILRQKVCGFWAFGVESIGLETFVLRFSRGSFAK